MNKVADAPFGARPDALTISRHFAASREALFEAWSSAEHIKRWFAPETCSVPEAEVDFRPGGVFNVCIRLPDGTDHRMRGRFVEVAPHDRLTFQSTVSGSGKDLCSVFTTVTFVSRGGGTDLHVRQEYDILDRAFMTSMQGAAEGWRSTLNHLADEAARIVAAETVPAVHGMFTLKRNYGAAPPVVFRALTNADAKARWFTGSAEFTALERHMDVRPGGRERLQGRWASGLVTNFDAVYFDVVENRRLVYAYEMMIDSRKISVSLATLQLRPHAGGTELVLTEQGSFLDGYDDAGAREHGTGELLDRLGESLQAD